MEAHTIGKASARGRRASRAGSRRPSRLRRAWKRVRDFEREWSVAGPALFAGIAATLLIYNHVQRTVTDLVFWLGLALLGAVFTWLVQNNHHRARVDQVTGLPNRLQLSNDLTGMLKDSHESQVMVLLELEGVTDYRDRLGFRASDKLLRGFSSRFAEFVSGLDGIAYRIEGGQFCALVPAYDRDENEIATAIFLSGAEGEGGAEAVLGRAHGVVTLPEDATDSDEALRLAGRRLAEDRRRQRESAKHQAHDTLMAILSKRHPEMVPHLRAVAYHVLSVGRRLELTREQLDDVVFAARLQHVGMLSVPDAAIESQSHLSASDSILLRDLPGAGAEIIASAPALAPVAKLVRSSRENYDGSGYPDGLAGDRIPLGSRILAVCVSYVVLTSKRADQRPLSESEALAELRRNAGKQFDPRVVEVLAEDLAEA
jgi:HD-GYP domain-containing protein (c-di-GMP phosphodiesterase class II)